MSSTTWVNTLCGSSSTTIPGARGLDGRGLAARHARDDISCHRGALLLPRCRRAAGAVFLVGRAIATSGKHITSRCATGSGRHSHDLFSGELSREGLYSDLTVDRDGGEGRAVRSTSHASVATWPGGGSTRPAVSDPGRSQRAAVMPVPAYVLCVRRYIDRAVRPPRGRRPVRSAHPAMPTTVWWRGRALAS
jgi:hypothetical protein